MSSPPKRPRVIFDPDADEPKPAAPPAPSVAPISAAPPLPGGAPRRPFAPDAPPVAAPVAGEPLAPEGAAPAGAPPRMTERQIAAQNADKRTPKVKPYHGSCPACGHGSMFPLVRFYETDVNENPTADAIMPNKMGARLFPGLSFAIMMITWLGGMSWDKGRVARGRAKVRKAREEILPRCPQAVICARCQEVVERF